ncbi:hypothetical protein [Roseiterribacter gracilis]|uniref:Cysteine rich repeat-containing protein n=1 Tax=Roseiterribacter gracilis TaxID=2812848 RepID=A0A8S8X9D2_9PROT|nr:hypothetical protein TMPK1_23300 [Rhodospirillales bacterium TMPK1]
MKSVVIASAFALLLASGASAQTQSKPLLDRAVVEKASAEQRDAFATCVEGAVKSCQVPTCKAGSKAAVQQCHESYGKCQATKVRECSDRSLKAK